MVCELLGAKMVAPVYGTSLFVWSSVIGVTLAGLTAGYFAGGFLVDRFTGDSLLFTILAVGACTVAAHADDSGACHGSISCLSEAFADG
jgi:hypothetical protein